MGTRADFYVGRGAQAEWLGSIAFDGHDENFKDLLAAKSEIEFRQIVEKRLREDDATLPAQGWPWPWEDSHTTDFAYAWDEGKAWATCFGHGWRTLDDIERHEEAYRRWEAADDGSDEPECWSDSKASTVFPDMTSRAAVTHGPRSGLIVMIRRG